MPKKFPVSLPNSSQRSRIFKLILRDTKIDRSHFDLDYLVRISAGMSGSDIKEACRDAAMGPVREYIKERKGSGRPMRNVDPGEVRGLRTEDFLGKKSGVGPMKNARPEDLNEKSRHVEEIDDDDHDESDVEEVSDEEFSEPSHH